MMVAVLLLWLIGGVTFSVHGYADVGCNSDNSVLGSWYEAVSR
jgi:hypothetical protein